MVQSLNDISIWPHSGHVHENGVALLELRKYNRYANVSLDPMPLCRFLTRLANNRDWSIRNHELHVPSYPGHGTVGGDVHCEV